MHVYTNPPRSITLFPIKPQKVINVAGNVLISLQNVHGYLVTFSQVWHFTNPLLNVSVILLPYYVSLHLCIVDVFFS